MGGRFVGFRKREALRSFLPIHAADAAAAVSCEAAPARKILAIIRRLAPNPCSKPFNKPALSGRLRH